MTMYDATNQTLNLRSHQGLLIRPKSLNNILDRALPQILHKIVHVATDLNLAINFDNKLITNRFVLAIITISNNLNKDGFLFQKCNTLFKLLSEGLRFGEDDILLFEEGNFCDVGLPAFFAGFF